MQATYKPSLHSLLICTPHLPSQPQTPPTNIDTTTTTRHESSSPRPSDSLGALLGKRWFPCQGSACPTTTWAAHDRLEWLRSQVIGRDAEADTPFGRHKMVYADHTASGMPLHFVEDFMLHNVLPFYGNTHTEDSYVGRVMSRMVHESESYIRQQLGGSAEEHALLFCGSGATAAIKRLQEVIGVAITPLLRSHVLRSLEEENTSTEFSSLQRWVVFTGPYEHHSNLLSWRHSLAEVVEIPADGGQEGRIDMKELENALRKYSTMDGPKKNKRRRRKLLGSFSACSNVTGLLTDTRAVARLLHKYGAFACFDFAAAAPHEEMDMKTAAMDGDDEVGYYDAVVMSPHKMMGGPGTPGLLLMRRALYELQHTAPSTAGGGTVSYVNGFSEEDTLYHDDIEVREDAGTPPILGKIRCALTFWVKEFVGIDTIQQIESFYINKATHQLSSHPNIKILGQSTMQRMHHRASILSFNVVDPNSKPLHGRFVVSLLNDLFGIQSRGGCACAGPYGHYLLGIDKDAALIIRDGIKKGYEGLKPSWTRVSFSYNMSEKEVNYVISSIEWVANYGHRLLSIYSFDSKTGNWTYNCPSDLEFLMLHNTNRMLNVKKFLQALTLVTKTCENTSSNHNVTSRGEGQN